MNISYKWLREYCNVSLSVDQLAKLLPELGLQIEAVEPKDGDTVFVLEITANRPDLLSVIGVAREVAAAANTPLKLPPVALKTAGGKVQDKTAVANDAPDLCLRYTARLVTGVRIGPSPAWLQQRLEAVGLRPVNNVVDITNFVLMECGQPLHAFDFDKLRGKRIVVRRAKPGEPITAIDGSVHKLTPEMLVIADAEVPTAVAGIMGGLDTEISDATKNVLVESAQFLPANIRRTSRALGLASDSSYRFERSVDPNGIDWASRRAAALIAEIAGGQILDGVIDVGQPVPAEKRIRFRSARARTALGVELSNERQRSLLEGLGCIVLSERSDELELSIPTFRPDLSREIDLIEEIARTHGYNNIPVETAMHVRAVPVQKADLVAAKVRDICVGLGCIEARTSSFIATDLARRFTHWAPDVNVIRNPVNREEPALRTSLIPQLLRVKKTNLNKGADEPLFFELSKIYGRNGAQPIEKTCLTLLDDGGYASLRGTIDTLIEHLGIAGPADYVDHADPNFASGRLAKLVLNISAAGKTSQRLLGFLGEISPALAALYDIKTAPAAAELDFDLLVELAALGRRFQPLPRFPSVKRDLCVVVDDPIQWAALRAVAANEAGALAETIAFQSEYRGEQVPAGKKAVAFSVVFRSPDRTLTGEEADAIMSRIAANMTKQFAATLRA